jgi:gamma-glutamylcyclotransferase
MMFGPIRVLAVDDDPAHLLAITSGLAASGIPCAGYWYDRDTGSLSPAPTLKLSHVRLIFMDLNLAEIAGGPPSTASLCATVMEVLEQLLSADAGPYLLVFWTNASSRVRDVAAMLYERLEQAHGVPCPLAVGELAKGPFIVNEPHEKDFKSGLAKFHADLHARLPDLANAVAGVVASDPQLNLLCAWETRAAAAAAGAVNEIFWCARDDAPAVDRTQAVKRICAKVALAASGDASAKAAPARAFDAGMADILVDQFGASVDELAYRSAVIASIDVTLSTGDIRCNDDLRVSAALNTFFHVDTEVATTTAAERGVVVTAKPFNKNELGFRLDEQLNDFLIAWESVPVERQLEFKALWMELRKRQLEFVLIEIGADCDHAQNTSRTRRFLLGLEVPKHFTGLLRFPGNGKLRNDALELLGPWTLDGEEMWLLVSCRRFWIWQEKQPHAKSRVKYRLRGAIVEKLLHRYASWHSRPGVIEFNPASVSAPALYFAYGSNMYGGRLKALAPSAKKLCIATLTGHKLTFAKVSTDGSGKCHIEKTDVASDLVYGVLFLLEGKDWPALDVREGGYRRTEVTVSTPDGACVATTYVAEAVDPMVIPFDWYVAYVQAGAEEHGLPADYLAQIQATTVKEDADQERAAKHKAAVAKTPPPAAASGVPLGPTHS